MSRHKKKQDVSTRRKSSSKRRRRRSYTSEEGETEETEETDQVTDESSYREKKERKKRGNSRRKPEETQGFTKSGRMFAILSPSRFNPDHRVSISTDNSELPPPSPKIKRQQRERRDNTKQDKTPRRRDSHRRDKTPRRSNTSKTRDSPRKSKNKNKKDRSHKKESVAPPCCPLCTKPYDCPILLRCAHTFCKDCVTVFVESSDGTFFKCPVCLTKIKLNGVDEELFCPNFVILQQVEGEKQDHDDLVCSVCEDENEAEYYCENCSDLLCEECADAHKVVKYTKEHTIKEITEETDLSNFIQKRYFCSQHDGKLLDSFCTACQQSVCDECLSKNHHGNKHNCMPISHAAKVGREEMERNLLNIKSHAPNLQLALLDIKRVKKVLRKQVNSVRNEISESMKRLMAVLKEKEKNLYQSVDRVYKSKINRLSTQKEKILLELEKIEACSRVISDMDGHVNNVEVLQMKTTILENLKALENTKGHLEIDKDTFLLKSNETNIKDEISKHGQVFRVDSTGNEFKKSRSSNQMKGQDKVVLISDFEDNAVRHNSIDNKNQLAKIVDNTCDYTKGRQLKAKGNWLIVKSRVKDIIKYGKLRDCIRYKPKTASPSEVYTKRLRRAKARTLKAKGNWLILKSHLSDVLRNKPPPKLAHRRKKEESVLHVWSSLTTGKRRKPPLRPRALKARARANWLLIQSRVRDIVDYGRITGELPFITNRMFQLTANRRRESKTLLKLKRYRAITLRARANWLLISSRLKDIIAYPKKQKEKPQHAGEIWRNYRERLLSNREKASRNKQIAGEIRARANWLIVKSRIPDIILYGLYRKYLNVRDKNKPKKKDRSRSASPAKIAERTGSSLRSRSTSPSKTNWDILISGTTTKRSRSMSPMKTSKKQKVDWERLISSLPTQQQVPKGEAFRNWDFLVKTPPKLSTTGAKENWNRLVKGTEVSQRKPKNGNEDRALTHWDVLSNSSLGESNTEKKSKRALKEWDTLIKQTPFSGKEALKGWDNLVRQTPSMSKNKAKSFESLNDWHKLISSTPTNKPNNVDGLNNWQQLVKHTPGIRKRDQVSEKCWDILIKGTKVDKTESGKDHWDKVKVGLGKTRSKDSVSEIEKNWDKLIANVEPEEKAQKECKLPTKSAQKDSEAKEEKNWHALINGTHGTIDKKAENNWHDLISGTKAGDSKSFKHWDALVAYNNDDKCLQRWDKLIQGTNSDDDANEETIQNWMHLIQSTPCINEEQALHDWDKLIKSGDKNKPSKSTYKHWDKLIEGKIIRQKKTIEIAPAESWDILIAAPSPIVSPAPSPQSSRSSSLFRNWHKLTSKTPPLPKSRKSIGDAVKNWNTLITNRGDKEDLALDHWDTLLKGQKNPYEAYIDKQPPGVTKLYEKPTPSGGNETKVLSLNIKNSKGEFHNVNLKLSSPDKSILSAHVAENSDGTFTIFSCPRIDNDFNMFVSLSGKQFKNEIKVVNFYGSFAGIRKQEVDLACRTISLLRWHLTPGLLTKKGDKIVARKGSIR